MSPTAHAYRPTVRTRPSAGPVVLVLLGGVEHALTPAVALRLAAELMMAASTAEEMSS